MDGLKHEKGHERRRMAMNNTPETFSPKTLSPESHLRQGTKLGSEFMPQTQRTRNLPQNGREPMLWRETATRRTRSNALMQKRRKIKIVNVQHMKPRIEPEEEEVEEEEPVQEADRDTESDERRSATMLTPRKKKNKPQSSPSLGARSRRAPHTPQQQHMETRLQRRQRLQQRQLRADDEDRRTGRRTNCCTAHCLWGGMAKSGRISRAPRGPASR